MATYAMPVDDRTARDHYQGREITLYGQQRPQFDGTTSYRTDFHPHQLEARPGHRGPAQYTGNMVPFDGTTTYGSEFKAHAMPERMAPPGNQYHTTSAPFDGTTTYGTTYIPHPMERPNMNRGPVTFREPLPFDGTTSYRNDFPAHAMPERPMGAAQPYQPASAPFDASTTYNGDFVPHAFEPRPANHAPNGTARNHIPFEGSTTYGDQFKPFPIQPHAARGRAQYQPTDTKFEGMSESMDKYRAWAIDPANRRGQGPPPMRPSLPFDGSTTHRELFKGWQLPPRKPALGIQMVGDQAYILIPANAPLPALGRQVFTTVHDNQTEISILVLEGDFTQASRCSVLGQFDMTGLPPGTKGGAKIEVTFFIDQQGVLNVSAMDLNTQRQEQWLRDGFLVAKVNPNP